MECGTFRTSVDGKPLCHPEGKYPYRRILGWHAKVSIENAIAQGWIDGSDEMTRSMTNLLEMSDKVSVDVAQARLAAMLGEDFYE